MPAVKRGDGHAHGERVLFRWPSSEERDEEMRQNPSSYVSLSENQKMSITLHLQARYKARQCGEDRGIRGGLHPQGAYSSVVESPSCKVD